MIERSDPDSTHALKIFDKMVKELKDNELPREETKVVGKKVPGQLNNDVNSIPSQVMFNNNSSNSDSVKPARTSNWDVSPIASTVLKKEPEA
jgi:hypothetical protein